MSFELPLRVPFPGGGSPVHALGTHPDLAARPLTLFLRVHPGAGGLRVRGPRAERQCAAA